MDQDTLANHLARCGQREFEVACKLILKEVFNLNVINVDGANDGGTDYVSFSSGGVRDKVAYQITTQKTDVKNKAYRDAKKSISKLGVKRYFFLCTYNLSEVECRRLEGEITSELDLPTSVYAPTVIAGLMIEGKLVKRFLDRTGPVSDDCYDQNRFDYREVALHCYSFLSKDARNLKKEIYDDSLLLVLSGYPEGLEKEEIVEKAINMLALPSSKNYFLSRRIDSLMGRQLIFKKGEGELLVASSEMISDVADRKTLYDRELEDLFYAQENILRHYHIEWTKDDARQASIWIANTYMGRQLMVLESANASLADNFFNRIDKNGRNSLRDFLRKKKQVKPENLDSVTNKLLQHAETHPLIMKITSASVYLALEGSKPMVACKAIGVNSWRDMSMLLEPTLGIPYLCSLLYSGGRVNYYFDNAILAVDNCKTLGVQIIVPYYYIRECAGHLHMARKFNGLELDPQEMQYSSNAFVSNYYALKAQGISVPPLFLDYLATFSECIKIEMADYHDWIRRIMADLRMHFTRHGVKCTEVPKFSEKELEPIESQYSCYLQDRGIQKSNHLMVNDAFSLTYTNEDSIRGDSHWMILTNDRVLIEVAKEVGAYAWVAPPSDFNDLVQISKDLNEKELSSMVHSIASFRSPTLELGAKILDTIVHYASDKMQNGDFLEAFNRFKSEMIGAIGDYMDWKYINKRTIEFLVKQGVDIDPANEQNDVDM